MPHGNSKIATAAIVLSLGLCRAVTANAAAAFFLEEPFGIFGRVTPTGHAAVYLSNVCAASPTVLRPCAPGETGVVISRYHRVGGYDWIAIPLIPYLYAVEQPEQVPLYVNPEMVASLRDNYRRVHLEQIAPDSAGGTAPDGDWTQLVGAAYDRKIYSFEIETTEAQDQRLIEKLNSGKNKTHFNLFLYNCADFSRGIVNTYYPHATHRSLFADQGITTPKQIAKSLVSYSKRHSDLQFSCFVIAQVPGTLPRSGAVRGVFEAFLKKKYVLPVALLHPLVASGMAVAYVAMTSCDRRRSFASHLDGESEPASILADLQSNRANYAVAAGAARGK
ncbi:MAG TPA: hypothetical protein VN924_02895 [Bryobacteraceae bacterium]|nr:hypothetical protein [Bryobacteraceae bacterium]